MSHKRLPLGTEERRRNDHGREKGFLEQIAGQYCVDCCNCGARGLGFFGNAFNSATKEKEVRLKTVVAIGVLSQDPNKSTPFLRDWAIDVVDSYSGIPFSAKARDELRRTALPSKDAERLLDMMSKSLSGTNGGVFFESSVPNFKVFLNDDDITKYVPNISSRRPIVAPVGSGKIRVEFDGGKFETLFPVMKDHLTKIVVAPTGIFAESQCPLNRSLNDHARMARDVRVVRMSVLSPLRVILIESGILAACPAGVIPEMLAYSAGT